VRCSLYAVHLDFPMTDSLFKALLASVSEERRQRAKRFLRHEDACRSVAGEALARYCIGQREKVPARGIFFTLNEHGKPGVDLPGKTQFNVSHSGSWVVCAVDNGTVGVDVERIHGVDFEISKRFFGPAEHEDLALLSGEAKKERFFDYWTVKESYIKAIGSGLSHPLKSFSIFFKDGRIEMKVEKEMPVMHFKQYDLGQEYKCALCATHEDLPDEIVFVKAEELVSPFLPRQGLPGGVQ
jgi:4'-phosphopantetheinyl transferase